jgi:hypothetical protein
VSILIFLFGGLIEHMPIPVLQLFRIKYVELGALKCVVHYPSIVHYGSGNIRLYLRSQDSEAIQTAHREITAFQRINVT